MAPLTVKSTQEATNKYIVISANYHNFISFYNSNFGNRVSFQMLESC